MYINKGTPFELRCILNLLGQISFTPKLASDLSKEEKIVKSINKIINSDDNESDELHLKQTCKNIKWNIEINQFKEKAATEIVPKSVKEVNEENRPNILIEPFYIQCCYGYQLLVNFLRNAMLERQKLCPINRQRMKKRVDM